MYISLKMYEKESRESPKNLEKPENPMRASYKNLIAALKHEKREKKITKNPKNPEKILIFVSFFFGC